LRSPHDPIEGVHVQQDGARDSPLPKLVLGVTFNDGIEVIAHPTDRQPMTAAA
jgi:hypothetical protein